MGMSAVYTEAGDPADVVKLIDANGFEIRVRAKCLSV